jgi:hypothetical protein
VTTRPHSLASHGPTPRTVRRRKSAPALVAACAREWSKTVLGITRASARRRRKRPAALSAVRSTVRLLPETRAPVSERYGLSSVSDTPRWRAIAKAWTPMRSPHGLSRGNADRSQSTTPRPARARATAAALPAGPAPTTTASTRSIANSPSRSPETSRGTTQVEALVVGQSIHWYRRGWTPAHDAKWRMPRMLSSAASFEVSGACASQSGGRIGGGTVSGQGSAVFSVLS